ncbi:S66 peptidase family protein [Pseudomonas matsuisoli]|uniref:Murein tetrapeptide carboxypeptidase n=1 Tax=Pseudomonas matsuisoli TaxID=1515666 RepID=A0A917PWL5_9PSED|nr:LD-carboxypeptidase [Pseudomonas matsuisoli]GGJ95309.1 murein tetrapeptide carboxypeptidase [Pseudomonas matsuisoli]
MHDGFHLPGKVALIAPASAIAEAQLEATLRKLDALGIDYQLGTYATARHRYLAGTVEQRLADLHAAFEAPDVSMVWCLRGGYGCAQLLPGIDWALLKRASPRPLVGFSDISVLLSAFHRHGLPAIHGPQAGALGHAIPDDDRECAEREASLDSLAQLLDSGHGHFDLTHIAGPSAGVSGELIGGNLTALASAAGSEDGLYVPDEAILLLEDVGESYYRLERSLYQLLRGLNTARVKAVCLGHFTECPRKNVTHSLEEIFAEHLAPFGIPLYGGLPVGHGSENHAWPYGKRAELSGGRLAW